MCLLGLLFGGKRRFMAHTSWVKVESVNFVHRFSIRTGKGISKDEIVIWPTGY